jgi:hypothetical protein
MKEHMEEDIETKLADETKVVFNSGESMSNFSISPPLKKDWLMQDFWANKHAVAIMENIIGPKPQLCFASSNINIPRGSTLGRQCIAMPIRNTATSRSVSRSSYISTMYSPRMESLSFGLVSTKAGICKIRSSKEEAGLKNPCSRNAPRLLLPSNYVSLAARFACATFVSGTLVCRIIRTRFASLMSLSTFRAGIVAL